MAWRGLSRWTWPGSGRGARPLASGRRQGLLARSGSSWPCGRSRWKPCGLEDAGQAGLRSLASVSGQPALRGTTESSSRCLRVDKPATTTHTHSRHHQCRPAIRHAMVRASAPCEDRVARSPPSTQPSSPVRITATQTRSALISSSHFHPDGEVKGLTILGAAFRPCLAVVLPVQASPELRDLISTVCGPAFVVPDTVCCTQKQIETLRDSLGQAVPYVVFCCPTRRRRP